jgi:hypothetical protein
MFVMSPKVSDEIESFLQEWQQDELSLRSWFSRYFEALAAMKGVEMTFVARPGVSYSLRPRSTKEGSRPLFAMVDVIDDEPAARWLSVCFYGDLISDPDERGEVIPGGLQGEDGYCFDLMENDADLGAYILARLQEAAATGR